MFLTAYLFIAALFFARGNINAYRRRNTLPDNLQKHPNGLTWGLGFLSLFWPVVIIAKIMGWIPKPEQDSKK